MLFLANTVNLYPWRASMLCWFFTAAILALQPISTKAQCPNWDAGGATSIIQRGQQFPILLELKQKGRALSGAAYGRAKTPGPGGGGIKSVVGTVDGTIDGDSFSIQIFWPDELTGVYNAKVLATGRLDGETYDKNNSNNRQPWHSEWVLKCPPPPPPPKPIKSSGKAKKEPAPPPTPPFITASQVIAQPLVPFASVYLGWDGGPDHPKTEVWVSIDNGAEIPAFSIDYPPQHPIFKQPKIAAVEMKLSKGRHYTFVLRDGGATLSTITFYVP